jgi:hypothetical protein
MYQVVNNNPYLIKLLFPEIILPLVTYPIKLLFPKATLPVTP